MSPTVLFLLIAFSAILMIILVVRQSRRKSSRSADVKSTNPESFRVDLKPSGLPIDASLDGYYDDIGKIECLRKRGEYDKAFDVSWYWVQRILLFVEDWLSRDGEFSIGNIPAVDYAAKHLVAKRDHGKLQQLRNILRKSQELTPWLEYLDEAILVAKDFDVVIAHISEHPGCLQKDIYSALSVDGRKMSIVIRDAAERRLIKREKSGSSYALYLL